MFVSTNYWAKWFFGALGYITLKAAFFVLFRPHNLLNTQFLLLFIIALVLCGRCILNRSLHYVEKAGLVVLVLGLSFSLLLDSARPLLAGALTLALAHLALGLFRTVNKNA
jgi:hypothetical protein